MSYNENVPHSETPLVTKRYKITEEQDRQLSEIKERLNIDPSLIIRLALNSFLPKIESHHYNIDDAIKNLFKIGND